MSMKRSELHEKVWSTPITKLARELGISDVGLAKVCRRHAIPVPPRGYWAKLRAGQKPPRISLPTPELDVIVYFAASDPEERTRQKAIEAHRIEVLQTQTEAAVNLSPIAFAEDLEGAHPLVKTTQKYCERIPKLVEKDKRIGLGAWSAQEPRERPPPEQHGRYSLIHRGCLNINASLEPINWILRFHATFLRTLTEGGMKIVRREGGEDRKSRLSNGPAVEMHLKGEVLAFKFSEGYRRIRLTPTELAVKRKESSWASNYETRPSGKFTFTIEGSEYRASKTWQGSQEKLQELVEEIIRTAFQLAAVQPQYRREKEEREANERRAEQLRAQEQHRREAKAEQLKQAFAMLEADTQVRQLKEFLERMEQGISAFRPPFDERVRVWIGVVREELADRNPVDDIIHKCLSVPSWSTWPPAWWPIDRT